MKTCPKCQNLIPESSKFCEICGVPLDPRSAMLCPAGKHQMDATAQECPYCRADHESRMMGAPRSVVRKPTVAEPRKPTVAEPHSIPPLMGSARPVPPPPDFRPPAPAPAASQAPPAPPSPGRRGQTVFMQPAGPGAAPSPGPGTAGSPGVAARRVVGVLVTYSWKPEGQLFPVREGRNLIGRGPECDIQVPEDPALSSTNSHITFRKSFVIGDMVSMSGTELNGEPIEQQFVPLSNYARIRTGSTLWTFLVIEPDPTA